MFFADPTAAFAEIARVTRPDGRVALAVWDDLGHNAAYSRLADLLDELFGRAAGEALRAPFALGDATALGALARSGLDEPTVTMHRGIARFASLKAWLHTEIRGWTLADSIDDKGFSRLLDGASERLGEFVGADGVGFELSALVVRGGPACR